MNRKLKGRIVEVFGSQSDFAMNIGENESAVSRVIRGRRELNRESQVIWATALECKPEEIFPEELKH